MKLPSGDRAVIDASKVRDYLLSPSHPVGRFKAAFFAAIGFKQSDWQSLVAELARLAAEGDAMQGAISSFGQKYEIGGKLTGPSGRSATITSVWIVLHGDSRPRFVTAHPAKRP
jgi:hypothetical protein